VVRRPLVRGLLSASLAFALVAAAASGTAFSINSVQGPPLTAGAAGAVGPEPCTGAYDITWTVSSGSIVGVRAERIAPSTSSDPGLLYCADMPYAILVADAADVEVVPGVFDFTHPSWTVEWTGVTDATTGSIDASSTAPASGSLQLEVGTAVQLAIGPDPSDVPGAEQTVQVACGELASGGSESQFSDGDDEYCLYLFDQVGTATFTALRSIDVEYLVVAGGGGGGNTLGGGGGAGGLLTNVGGTALTLAPGTVTVEVGAAGLGSQSRIERAQNGGDSKFGSVVATGGGGGGSFANSVNAAQRDGAAGGSGGGNAGTSQSSSGGSGTAGQGNSGEAPGLASGMFSPGGGGGGAGSSALRTQNVGGTGGDGALSSITGAAVLYAAGGGGGSNGEGPGLGGSSDATNGGGGQGSTECTFDGTVPSAGTGSGGGGGGLSKSGDCDGPGGAGASGVVIVRIRLP